KDIQTSALSLQPIYDYSNNGQGKLTGFQVLNIVAITARDIGRVGELLDAAVTAGATSVDGVSFRVNDETGAEGQARTAAVADARAKEAAVRGGLARAGSGAAGLIQGGDLEDRAMAGVGHVQLAGLILAEAGDIAAAVEDR